MSHHFITSANAVFTLTIKELFNTPITLENWESDKAWEALDQDFSEVQMSIDGKLNIGWIPSPITHTLSFSPNSRSMIYFDTLLDAMRQTRRPFWMNGELTLEGLGHKFTFTNGVIQKATPLPAAGKSLAARKITIMWENITRAGI